MDLLATVRKEGSRGGRGDFKWSDVQNSSHREHYLGHSLMAPVGRWQKGKDLNWYAKGEEDPNDKEDPTAKAARERKEEIRIIKEAEEDALARALGLPVAPRNNANLEPVADKREVDKALQESAGQEDNRGGRGIGFGVLQGAAGDQVLGERLEGNAEGQGKELSYALKEYERRHGDSGRRRRSRSPDRERKRHRRHHEREGHRHRRHRSRSPERHHRRRTRSRSRSRSRSPERQVRDRTQNRSRSPFRRREDRDKRHRKSSRDERRR